MAAIVETLGEPHRIFILITFILIHFNSQAASKEDDENARNPGSNLFVTGIHPRLTEEDVSRLFEKFGEVEKANIMRDPHSGDSRGFGFVKMVTPEQADAAREGLHGVVHEGRTLSIEKARRARPRTPTPGKYYGPPKRGKSLYIHPT
jgi:RNA recognition motif-containing protein